MATTAVDHGNDTNQNPAAHSINIGTHNVGLEALHQVVVGCCRRGRWRRWLLLLLRPACWHMLRQPACRRHLGDGWTVRPCCACKGVLYALVGACAGDGHARWRWRRAVAAAWPRGEAVLPRADGLPERKGKDAACNLRQQGSE